MIKLFSSYRNPRVGADLRFIKTHHKLTIYLINMIVKGTGNDDIGHR